MSSKTAKKRSDRYHNKLRDKWDKALQAMLEKEIKPMTEDEWHKVCEYFGGCAVCGEPHIESREFFLGFQDGGRYTAWNMFPQCGKCATHTRFVSNPFIWLDKRLGGARFIGLTDERREKMLKYFLDRGSII